MPGGRPNSPNVSSGRRGYIRYQYGDHFWIPETLADFSKGMVRDTARVAIPDGSVYDSADYLLHQPGVAQKRGGTAYAGPALTGASFVIGLVHAPYFAGSQLLAVGSNGHLFKVTAGTTTDIGDLTYTSYVPPIVSPAGTYVVFPRPAAIPTKKFDGTTITDFASGLIGMSQAGVYKGRMVRSDSADGKTYFSQSPDVNAAWDTTNSFIGGDFPIVGFGALNNTLLIFSSGHTERIIGAIPPPNSDMDRAPLAAVGCTDQRSIVVADGVVYFANPQGVWMTNGGKPDCITDQGGIGTYWRSLFASYLPAVNVPSASSWTIAAGFWRGFLFVSVLDNSRNLQATLMCNVARRAWWRLTNVKAMCYASSVDGNEFYYGDASTNRVVQLSGIFSPAAGNKNDADGTAVTPTIEFRPVGNGTGVKSFAFGHLDFDMRDAASDNPTMAVTVKTGIEADTSSTPAESPIAEVTTTLERPRFTIAADAQAVTVALAQTNASSKTEIYALEVEQRPQSLVGEGIS